ncbi:fumarylacetoacetate hydrolase family protein [Frankia sp. AgB32]|nr:fumarylacetoacetate hydrolase family protein [Frankia sp. AgB32]MCK9894469.1 fumarylacetoacetate hydrolase family protein [Frankia sp. AgB32]
MSVPTIDHAGPWALARLADPGGGPFPALVARIVAYCSTVSTLLPGDLVLTGSPAGNGLPRGRLPRAGDVMNSTITGLGAQSDRRVAEAGALEQNGTRR